MTKRTKFEVEIHSGKIYLVDTAGNTYPLSVAQSKRLRGGLRGAEKQLKRMERRVRVFRRAVAQ